MNRKMRILARSPKAARRRPLTAVPEPDDTQRLALEAEQRLLLLRETAFAQREAARELIRSLGEALSALDSAWADFEDRLDAASVEGGAGVARTRAAQSA